MKLVDRRRFLKSAVCAGAGAAVTGRASAALGADPRETVAKQPDNRCLTTVQTKCIERPSQCHVIADAPVPPRNRRPYSGLDWSKVIQVNSTTHFHQDGGFMEAIKRRNIGFLLLSNYYPSIPAGRLEDSVWPRGVPVSNWPVMVNGKRVEGPFDWNEILKEWADEISEKDRADWPRYPFEPTRKTVDPKEIPPDLLEGPNAEHHGFKMADGFCAWGLHLCAPGSAFCSGTFDHHNRKKTFSHGYDFGSGEYWGTAIDRMIDALIVPDGGGVTINHPNWSMLNREFMLELLDYDPRVLGIEVLEAGVNSEHYWDFALATGRQCFGFFVPDHSIKIKDFGVCVLCVQERTVEACLRAYRRGDFYGAQHGLGELRFTEIAFDGKTLRASTDRPARFEVKTARGVVRTAEGRTVSWEVPEEASNKGPRVEVFARVKAFATDGSGEILFSQPFMLV